MRLSLYVPAASWLHRLDPRVKLAGLVLFSAAMLLFNDPVFLLLPFAGIAAVAVAAGVGRAYLVGAAVVTVVGALSFLFWPLMLRLQGAGGPDVWAFGFGMGLRLVAMLLAGLLVLLTARTEEILAALARVLPFPAVFALGLTFRLLPALLQTANHVVEAQRLRGLEFRGGLVRRARRFVPLLVPILGGALRSAHRMAWALEAKGFGGPGPRAPYLALAMRPADWVALGAEVLGAAAAVALRVQGIGYRVFASLT